MRIIIAGTRDYVSTPGSDDLLLGSIDDAVKKLTGADAGADFADIKIISGGCRGIDALGERYAKLRDCRLDVMPAEWRIGKQAGPLRNRRMAMNADALIAVYYDKRIGAGTRDMIKRATQLGLRMCKITLSPRPPEVEFDV
jgi:hypothetical protein